MHPNADLVETFYRSFAARDAAGMADCYHEQVHFTDPVFDLRGAAAAGRRTGVEGRLARGGARGQSADARGD